MTSKQKILGTIRGQRVDRVPVWVLNTFRSFRDDFRNGSRKLDASHLDPIYSNFWDDFRDSWRKIDRNYQELVAYAREYTDIIHRFLFPKFDPRFLFIPQESIKRIEKKINEDTKIYDYRVKTPKGLLRYVVEAKRNISTVWNKEPLLKSKGDVEKILSIPFRLREPDLDFFFRTEKELGDKGVMEVWVSTPLVCVSQMFHFQKFLMWCLTERKLIEELIETAFERIYVQLEYLLQNGVGPIIEFGGSEQATPPMMSPELYDAFVVKYDRQLFELVKRYGCHVHVHCHGRINTVLEKMLNMGVEMLNPVEAPPSGDIELAEAKKRTRGRMTLVGNIQCRDLEFNEPEEIDQKVREAICNGGKQRFILSTTSLANPLTFVSDRLRDNYIRLITSAKVI